MPKMDAQALEALTDKYGNGRKAKPVSLLTRPKIQSEMLANGDVIQSQNGQLLSNPPETAPSVEEISADQPKRPLHLGVPNGHDDQTRANIGDTPARGRPPAIIDANYEEIPSNDGYLLPQTLRHVTPEDIQSREQLLTKLATSLPLNVINMPTHIYRPDFVAPSDFGPLEAYWKLAAGATPDIALQLELQNLDDAILKSRVELDYMEGFPSVEGQPIWHKLPWEPLECHQAFKLYLEQVKDDDYETATDTRRLSRLVHLPYAQSKSYYDLYCWPLRVRSFELYKVSVHHQTRIRRSLTLDDIHYRMAGRMLEQVNKQFNKLTDEVWDTVSPDKLVNMAEKLMKIQRLSAGLSPINNNDPVAPAAPTINVTMQQIAQSSGSDDVQKQKVQILDDLSASDDMLEAAQALLITHQNQEFNVQQYRGEAVPKDEQSSPNDEADEGIEILNG